MMHQNIQGIKSKIDELNIYLECNNYNKIKNFDCLALTEHFLSSGEDKYVNLKGYRVVSCFTRTNHIRGGSCIFLKDEIECFARHDLEKKKCRVRPRMQ